MKNAVLEDLVKFCEERNLTEVALGLKQDLLQTAQKQSHKEMQERALQIIRKAVKSEEAKRAKEEVQAKRGSGQPI